MRRGHTVYPGAIAHNNQAHTIRVWLSDGGGYRAGGCRQ